MTCSLLPGISSQHNTSSNNLCQPLKPTTSAKPVCTWASVIRIGTDRTARKLNTTEQRMTDSLIAVFDTIQLVAEIQNAIKLLKEPTSSMRSMHIDVADHIARERVAPGEVAFSYRKDPNRMTH